MGRDMRQGGILSLKLKESIIFTEGVNNFVIVFIIFDNTFKTRLLS